MVFRILMPGGLFHGNDGFPYFDTERPCFPAMNCRSERRSPTFVGLIPDWWPEG
jgi:hypothetical protein